MCGSPRGSHRGSAAGWSGRTAVPSAVLLLLDVGDGIADRLEVLHLVVGDLDVELLLGGDDDLDHRQRVDVQVVDERLVELYVVGGDARDLVDDLGQGAADLPGGSHGQLRSFFGLRLLQNVVQQVVYGTRTTCAAYASPAPNAMSRARSPLLASPSAIMRSSASGIDAADALPWSAMSRAILTWS